MTGWFFENLAWASAVMLLVLAVRRPVARLFGAGPAYALWLLPLLRLLVPPQSWFAANIPSLLPPLDFFVLASESAAPVTAESGPIQWAPILLALWAGGAAAFTIWQWLNYRSFLTRLSLSSRSLGGHRGLPLVESDAVCGPLALGLLDRRIVVPADFASRYSPEEQRLALDHELIHHRRGDIWCNHAALLFLGLNWFNPIAWAAFRAFRIDQELACDAAVAAAAPGEARQDYARAMIKSASRTGLLAACPLNHADQLKRRLKMMKTHRSSRLRLIGGSLAVATLAGVSLTLGTPGLAHPHPGEGESEEIRRERVVVIDERREGGVAHRDGEDHVIRLRRGDRGERAIVLPRRCEGDNELLNLDEGDDNDRTRIIMCSRGEADSASRLDRIQRVRERIASNERVDEHRDRILSAIDREITRLRGQ